VSAYLQSLFGLEGKVALVTGGGRGIGRLITEAYLQAGAARVYIASRNEEELRKSADEITPDGRCIAIAADLANDDGCRMLAAAIAEREQKLDILVNNSGATWLGSLDNFPRQAWDKLFAINLRAPFVLTAALAPLLEAAGDPDEFSRVINVGSIAGEMPDSLNTWAYGLSKGGLHHLTQMLAREFFGRCISVNAIAPGRFPTKMTKAIAADTARYQRELSSIPSGRWGRADDAAGLTIFLASRAGGYLNGAVVALDGGILALGPVPQAR
jgi:NAD(P)-dependent dehydrogenase (short-subunit alcohol dehydrogenase family)